MHAVRHDPTRLQPCRRIRGRKNTTRLPTLNPEEPFFCSQDAVLFDAIETLVGRHGFSDRWSLFKRRYVDE